MSVIKIRPPRVEPLGPAIRQACFESWQVGGVTLPHWARVLEVSYPTLHGLAVGDVTATHRVLTTAARWARCLGVPPDQIFETPTRVPVVPIEITLKDLARLEEFASSLPFVVGFCAERRAQLEAERASTLATAP